jgi:hypothetical protein
LLEDFFERRGREGFAKSAEEDRRKPKGIPRKIKEYEEELKWFECIFKFLN